MHLTDFTQVQVHLIVTTLSCLRALLLLSFLLLVFVSLLLHILSGSFLQLCKGHLGTLWVFLKDPVIGLLPFVKDFLQTIVSLSLGSLNQVLDLQTLLSQLNYSFIVFGENLTFSHLQLFVVSSLLSSESLLLPRLSVNGLRQDSLLLVQIL